MVFLKQVLCFFLFLLVQQASSSSIHGCYLSNATNPQQQFQNLNLETYIPHLCSHIFFSYAQIKDDFSLDLVNPGHLKWGAENKFYNQLTELKSQQHGLKTILSVGGSSELKELLVDDKKRQTFVQTAANFVKQFDFDGVNIFVSQSINNKAAFTELIKDFKVALPENLVIVSAPSDIEAFDTTYDVPAIAKYSNFVNILEGQSIAKSSNLLLDESTSNEFDSMYKWVSNGLSKNKLFVGLDVHEKDEHHNYYTQAMVNTSSDFLKIKNRWMKENGFGGAFVQLLDERKIHARASCCDQYQDQAIVDNDLGDVIGPIEECCGICASYTGCLGWTWENKDGGKCLFKTTSGPTVTKIGAITGLFCENRQKAGKNKTGKTEGKIEL